MIREEQVLCLDITEHQLDRDEEGTRSVECPAIPGGLSQGETRDEALENIKDAIQGRLQVRAEKGMPLTVETRQVEVVA